jgi:transcriptional regulator with XRE-family HTH domain
VTPGLQKERVLGVSVREFGRYRQALVGQRIARRRSDLGLRQTEILGRLDELGLTMSAGGLSSMERGIGLDVGKLLPLSLALECTITYLLGLTTEPNSWDPDSKLDLKAEARTTPE